MAVQPSQNDKCRAPDSLNIVGIVLYNDRVNRTSFLGFMFTSSDIFVDRQARGFLRRWTVGRDLSSVLT